MYICTLSSGVIPSALPATCTPRVVDPRQVPGLNPECVPVPGHMSMLPKSSMGSSLSECFC